MSPLFQNKYRIESARAQWWDYRNPGTYFITICTNQRQPSLGEIHGQHMYLSIVGQISLTCWHEIPRHQDIPITINACAILPDHMHGLLTLGYPSDPVAPVVERQQCCVSTTGIIPAHRIIQPNSVPSIMRNFKSAVTTYARQIGADFAWQPRYHDTIVRNPDSFRRIQQYITHNVAKHATSTNIGYHQRVIQDVGL